MPYNRELMEELNVLALFDLESTQTGIKVHSDARPELIEATKRLYEKGLVSNPDGGYLTPLGQDAAENSSVLLTILNTASGL